MSYFEVEDLSARYGKALALSDISMRAERGEIVAVLGPNGAGKSTLLDAVMGMVAVSGDIRLDGRSLLGASPGEVVRRGVGYAPERFNLFSHMSVRDNLLVGGYAARGDIARNLDIVHRLFPRLEERERQEASTQSGGERQMLSLGRALMTSPSLLLVDEPTIGLAPKICDEIADIVRRMRDEYGLTVVMAEQNANFAMTLAERLYVLESGRMTASGTVDELRSEDRIARAYFGR